MSTPNLRFIDLLNASVCNESNRKKFLNVKDENLNTPLHMAADFNIYHLCKKIILKGADVNAENIDGHTPLRFALLRSKASIVNLLFQYGAKIDNNLDLDAIIGLFGCPVETRERVFNRGFDINQRDQLGRTFLHHAVLQNHPESVIRTLINNGIDITIEDNEHKTALDLALENTFNSNARIVLIHHAIREASLFPHEPPEPLSRMLNKVELEKEGSSLHIKCLRESKNMMRMPLFPESDITMYEFLTGPLSRIVTFMNKPKNHAQFCDTLLFTHSAYPEYRYKFDHRLFHVQRKLKILNSGRELIGNIINAREKRLPDFVSDFLVHYFNEKELIPLFDDYKNRRIAES